MYESVSAVDVSCRYGEVGVNQINTIYKRKAINGSFLPIPSINHHNLLSMTLVCGLMMATVYSM